MISTKWIIGFHVTVTANGIHCQLDAESTGYLEHAMKGNMTPARCDRAAGTSLVRFEGIPEEQGLEILR
jgi:hypothetical protein